MVRFLLRWAVLFVVSNIIGFVVHGLLLHHDYATVPQLLRTEQDANRHFGYMLLGFASSSAALLWIYGRGVEARPWLGQGIRFGLCIWLLTSVPWFLTYYAVQPWPGIIVCKQIAFEFVGVLLIGVVIAALHRKEAAGAPGHSRVAAV